MPRGLLRPLVALAFKSCVAVLSVPSGAALTQPAKPNVALIRADNVGYGNLGRYGDEFRGVPMSPIDHTRSAHMCGRLSASMEPSGEKQCNSQQY